MSFPLSKNKDSKEFVKKFTKFASSISEGVIISDEKEGIIWVNKSFEKISGYTLKELIGKGPEIFHGEKTNKSAVRNLRKSIKKGETVSIELVNYKPDGTPYWINLTITPILNENNKVTKYISFERDITEQKLIEKNKGQSDEIYKVLFKKSPVNMFIFDPVTYKMIEANEAALCTYGYTKEDFLKLTVKDIRPPEDWKKVKKIIKDVKEEFVLKGVWRHLKKNGDTIFVDIKASAIEYNGKKAILTITTDVTDRHLKELEVEDLNENLTLLNDSLKKNLSKNNELLRELKIKEQKLSAARQSAKIGTWEIDIKTNKITASEEVYNIFNIKPNEKLSFKKFQSRVHPDDLDRYTKTINDLVVNSEPIDIEYKLKPINGNCKHIVSKGALIYDDNGHPELLSGITIDITAKKHNEEKIAAQLKNISIILSGITSPFFVIDKKYNLLFINDTSARLSGFTKEELVGKNIFEVYPDRDFIEEKKEYDKAFKENKSRQFETTYLGRTFSVNLYPSEIGLAVSATEITENKKITKELEEKVKFIEEIGNNTPGGIIQTVYYPDGRVEAPYISAGFKELWGLNPEEVKKDIVKRFVPIHPEDRESVKNDIDNAIKNLVPLDHKFRFINQKSKEIKWVHAKAVPSKKEDGSVVLNGVFIDISESEKYYNELEKSNRRYEYVSKAANEVIWDWDLKTNIMELAGNYEELFGYEFPDNKVPFEFVQSRIHPDDLEIVKKNIEFGMADIENHHRDNYYRMFDINDKIIYIYERSYTIFDPVTNEPLKIIGTAQDITLRKKHEEEIKEKAKFIQHLSNNIPGAIFQSVYYPDGTSKMTFASEGFRELWGMSVEEVLKNSEKRFIPIHKDDIDKIKSEVKNTLENLLPLDCKYRFVNQETGKISWVRSKSIPEKLQDGSIVLTGVIVDVTDTEKYYNELEKSNERYEYVSKAANEGIWDWDLTTNIVKIGGSFNEMMKSKIELTEITFETLVNSIHAEDKERVDKKFMTFLQDSTQRYWEDTFRLINIDGEIVHTYQRGYAIYDEKANKPVRFVGSAFDITRRVKDEEAIKAEIRRNNIIVESMTDPFFVIGKDLKVILANKAGLALANKNKEDLLGKEMYSFEFVRNHQVLSDLFKETMDKNETFQGEFKLSNKWFDVLLYPSEIGLAVHARDITKRKNQQDELEKNVKFIKEISDSTPGFIFQLEFDSSLTPKLNYASENAANYWGFPVSDAINGKEEIFRSVHKDDFPDFMQSMLNCAKNLTNLNNKFRLVNIITNEIKWMRIIAIGTKLKNGNSIINGSVIDITDAETYYTKLEQANQRYEHVSKATNNTIWELDLKKDVCIIGGAYEEMFGYKLPDNILTDEFHTRLLHPDDLEEVNRSKQEALNDKTKRYWERSYRIIRKDGEVRYVNDRAYIVYDDATETPLKIIGSTQDITENKEYEEALKKNAKFIKEISESMHGFIFQTEYDENYNAKLNFASKNAYDYWGVTPEEVIADQSKLLDSIHFEDIAEVVNKRIESAKNLTNMNFKFRYVNKTTGVIKWVRAMAVPTRLENGHTLVNGTIVDITETENYYNKLEEATRRYEYLSKATHETIWEMDVANMEILLGGGYKEMLGQEFPENKIPFTLWEKHVHPEDLERTVSSMHSVLTDPNKRYWESKYRIIREDGKVIDVFERAYIVYDEKNSIPVKIIGSTQDVTELNKVQAERDNMMADLVKRNKALEQFTYMVSHNLRAPIANILGISYLLDEGEHDEETLGEMHQLIKQSSSKLDNVIRDMNEILSVKKGFNEERTLVYFDDLLNDIIETEKKAIHDSKVTIISDFKEVESLVTIKNYMHGIFQNLISNGIKYRGTKSPWIKISSNEDENYVYLNFEDNGIGIDLEKNKDKIFGLYNKFHLNKEGKGMGLFMVKSHVESLDGEISVSSEVNKGTKYIIKLQK